MTETPEDVIREALEWHEYGSQDDRRAKALAALDDLTDQLAASQRKVAQYEAGLNVTGDEFDVADLRTEVMRLTDQLAAKDRALEAIADDTTEPRIREMAWESLSPPLPEQPEETQ